MTVDDLCQAVAVEKRLFGTLDWVLVNQTRRIGTTLEINGIIAQGLGFRITCCPDLPDEKVAIVLLFEIKSKPRPFARIDWRGQVHENRHAASGDLLYHDAGRTHFHSPEFHRSMTIDDLFTRPLDLPVARQIVPEPSSFEELLAEAAELLHIENLRDIPVPPWSPRASLF